jgi:S1-C subfamily serine protease
MSKVPSFPNCALPRLGLLLLAGLAAALSPINSHAQSNSTKKTSLTDPTNPAAPIDDKAIETQWLAAMQKLEDEGTTLLDGDTLVQQLKSRKTCRLPNPPWYAHSQPIQQPDWPAFYKNQAPKTVSVVARYKCGKCNQWHLRGGGGLVLSPDGIVATNHHVMNHADSAISAIALPDGSVFPIVEALAADPVADVAIVRAFTNGKNLSAPVLNLDAPVGLSVGLISTPGNNHYFFSVGVISRYGLRHNNGQSTARMSITADFARGSSGFPVFDSAGNAVGLVAATTTYYADDTGKKENPQMVFKNCVPVRSILRLIEGCLP